MWIPTVNHIPIPFDDPHNEGVKIADISDIIGRPFKIKVETDGNNINILTQNEKNPEIFDLFITLYYEKSSHNGMIKYSFEPKFFENGKFGFDDKSFPEVVYHIIKSFYHIHEFHEDETDSSLLPYLCKEDININEPDNKAIRHYLLNHEKIILVLVNLAREYAREVIDAEKRNPDFVLKDFGTFINLYIMVLGYDAYFHSLYKSIYNKNCHISNENEKRMRRCAFNIENSVRYFKVLFTFFDTKIRKNNTITILQNAERNLLNSEESLRGIGETLENSKKSLHTSEQTLQSSLQNIEKTKDAIKKTTDAAKDSTKWARRGIIFSALLSLISILYSIHLSNESSKELKETSTTQEQSLKNTIEKTDHKIDSLLQLLPAYNVELDKTSIQNKNIPNNREKEGNSKKNVK